MNGINYSFQQTHRFKHIVFYLQLKRFQTGMNDKCTLQRSM